MTTTTTSLIWIILSITACKTTTSETGDSSQASSGTALAKVQLGQRPPPPTSIEVFSEALQMPKGTNLDSALILDPTVQKCLTSSARRHAGEVKALVYGQTTSRGGLSGVQVETGDVDLRACLVGAAKSLKVEGATAGAFVVQIESLAPSDPRKGKVKTIRLERNDPQPTVKKYQKSPVTP